MLTIEWFEGDRTPLADLFALADDAPGQIERYRELGRVLVARHGPTVVGHLQLLVDDGLGQAEVKSLAVREDHQGTGAGRALVERAVAVCRAENQSELLVAAAAADTGVLRFYERLGFRFLRVERDVFTPEAGYPPVEIDGVPLRDQVWLSLTLPKRDGSLARGWRELR
jgi:GNAT superfamily N-acetyltransferase